MKTIAECLAANIKARRKTLHITQDQLAERTGLSTWTIAQIERQEAWVGKNTIESLARGLGVTETFLFQDFETKDELLASFLRIWAILDESKKQRVVNIVEMAFPNETSDSLKSIG